MIFHFSLKESGSTFVYDNIARVWSHVRINNVFVLAASDLVRIRPLRDIIMTYYVHLIVSIQPNMYINNKSDQVDSNIK